MLSLHRTGSNYLPYPQNLMNPQHTHIYSPTSLVETRDQERQQLNQDNMPWFARPVGTVGLCKAGLNSKPSYPAGSIRDKEFVSSSNPPIAITASTKIKNVAICIGGRLGSGSGSSNSTLSRSISPSSAEESFLNRNQAEDNYYSFYPSNNEEEKIRSVHRFHKNVRDDELHLPEGKDNLRFCI